MAGPPDLDVSHILSAKPYYYFQDFTIAEGSNKTIKDIYDFDANPNGAIKNKDDNDYKFKLFSMEIDNGLVEDGNCTNPAYTITITSDIRANTNNLYKNFFSKKEGGHALNTNMYDVELKTICGGKKIKFKIITRGGNKEEEITIDKTYKENLENLLNNIAANDANGYDIINFQDISPDNIEKINSVLNQDLDDTSRYKCVSYKAGNKYLTTFYDKKKFTLMGYELNGTENIYTTSYILYLKMNTDFRLICVENSLKTIEYNEEYKLNITPDTKIIFNQSEIDKINNIKLHEIKLHKTKSKILPKDQSEQFSLDMYKTFYIFCGKIKTKDKLDDKVHDFVNKEANNDNHKQHIKYPVYHKKFGVQNFINNIIIFSNKLEMKDDAAAKHSFSDADIFAKEREKINTRSDLYKFFTDNYASDGCGLGDDNKQMLKIVNTFEYLGHSNGLPMGVEFSLGDDDFTYETPSA